MTPDEEIAYLNKRAEAFLAPMGKALCYNRTGLGTLETREQVIR
jgi:hypothetical protein